MLLVIAVVIILIVIVAAVVFFMIKKSETFTALTTRQVWKPDTTVYTWEKPGTSFIMQGDGNLVLYDQGKGVWGINKWMAKGQELIFDPIGKLYVFNPNTNITHTLFDIKEENPVKTSPKFKNPYKLVFTNKKSAPNVYIVDSSDLIVWSALPYFSCKSASGKIPIFPKSPSKLTYKFPNLYVVNAASPSTLDTIISGKTADPKNAPPKTSTLPALQESVYIHLNKNDTFTFINYFNYALSDEYPHPYFNKQINYEDPAQQYIPTFAPPKMT